LDVSENDILFSAESLLEDTHTDIFI